jgi:hypothetical protein
VRMHLKSVVLNIPKQAQAAQHTRCIAIYITGICE